MSSVVARNLDLIRSKAAMRNVDVANLLGTRPETVSRWNQGKAYPQSSKETALLELEYIVDKLSGFYTPNEARQWIFSRQKLLGDVSPASMIQKGEIEKVILLVNQIRDAVHM